MDNELKTELAELKGILTGIRDSVKDVDDDVKSLAVDVKEIKSSVAEQGEKIATIKAETMHNKSEIEKLHAEDKSLWDHFPKHKDDIKEYVKIIVREAISNQKVWFYGIALTAAGAIIMHVVRGMMK